jgi:hypothetical protein
MALKSSHISREETDPYISNPKAIQISVEGFESLVEVSMVGR